LDYNDRIRKAIGSADRFVFLASRSALAPGKYTVTELEFVRRRWVAPEGQVFPILVDPELQPNDLPPYLRSIQSPRIGGNATAEIAAIVDRSRRLNTGGWIWLTIIGILVASVVLVAVRELHPHPAADIIVLTDKHMHFRPRMPPPPDTRLEGEQTKWIESPLTITTMISYNYRSASSPSAQVIGEDMLVEFGTISANYRWQFIVEFKDGGPARMVTGFVSKNRLAGKT
jgi:hypothetical protein